MATTRPEAGNWGPDRAAPGTFHRGIAAVDARPRWRPAFLLPGSPPLATAGFGAGTTPAECTHVLAEGQPTSGDLGLCV